MSIFPKVKQYGLINSGKRGFKFLLRKALGIHFESFYFMINHINIEELNLRMLHYDYSDVRELTLEDFKKGNPLVFTPSKMSLIEDRFKSGKYYAYGIVQKDVLAYSCWINTEELQFPRSFIKAKTLNFDEGLLQDAYCNPSFRGRGYHSKMNVLRLKKLHEQGRSKAIAIVLCENVPAYKTQLNSGFTVEKKMIFIKIMNRTFLFERVSYDRN